MTPLDPNKNLDEVLVGRGAHVSLDDLERLAHGAARPRLTDEATAAIVASAEAIDVLHGAGSHVYGVTTSVGASVSTRVPSDLSADLSVNVMRMHGCGTGRWLDDQESAAVLVTRLTSLAQGFSGVRSVVIQRIMTLLERRILPVIPAEGSVGASGDLTPLSYLAAVLAGEREVRVGADVVSASDALRAVDLEPLSLGPKEALAVMNGTSVATALAALGWLRARNIARVATTLTGLVSLSIRGNAEHFDPFVHDAKPHPGQIRAAARIRRVIRPSDSAPARLQDRYSIRCAPHVIGPLFDTLDWTRAWLEREINGVSDNPVVDADGGRVVHGGNFYGGHVVAACDAVKAAVATVAGLLDRQLMVLCNPAENDGLPANLVGVPGRAGRTHNGFKAVTIAASALAAEAAKTAMPASVFSRSTEVHNQDHVPMATLAARELNRVADLGERIVAMLAIAAAQGVELRGAELTDVGARFVERVREQAPPLGADRRLDREILAIADSVRRGDFSRLEPEDA